MKLLFYFLLFISTFSFSQRDSTKNNLSLDVGMSGSWWKYNRGLGEGWDRSDYVVFYNVDLSYHRQIKTIQIGVALSYGLMDEQYIEAFNDIPSERVKTPVSDTYIQFYSLGGEILKTVVSSSRYKLAIGVGAGTFGIKTNYPFQNTFGTKIYWNAFAKHQISLSKNYFFTIKMAYEKKHIFVPEGNEKEHHEILKSGIQLGLEKYF